MCGRLDDQRYQVFVTLATSFRQVLGLQAATDTPLCVIRQVERVMQPPGPVIVPEVMVGVARVTP